MEVLVPSPRPNIDRHKVPNFLPDSEFTTRDVLTVIDGLGVTHVIRGPYQMDYDESGDLVVGVEDSILPPIFKPQSVEIGTGPHPTITPIKP